MSFSRSPRSRKRLTRPRGRQRGIVLIITMIAMVVLLVGLAAVLRSVDTAGLMVSNLAFRRDLTNRAEEAIVAAKAAIATGTLSTATDTSKRYSAVKLANGTTGVPAILDDDSATGYAATYGNGSDVTDSSVANDQSVVLRYVIDRQCNANTGAFVISACEFISTNGPLSDVAQGRAINGAARPIYRISVRVKGPRGAFAYFQTTYAY